MPRAAGVALPAAFLMEGTRYENMPGTPACLTKWHRPWPFRPLPAFTSAAPRSRPNHGQPHVRTHTQTCALVTFRLSFYPPQINSAPARGPDHFPFAGFRDSGISTQGIPKSLEFMCKTKVRVSPRQFRRALAACSRALACSAPNEAPQHALQGACACQRTCEYATHTHNAVCRCFRPPRCRPQSSTCPPPHTPWAELVA